jgi:ribosomal protein S27E|tara:strand:+ start:253 stop:468 length:216 start_codon:yes stop_codon:yes gene_type:complete
MTGKKFYKFNAEVVTGKCPTCDLDTMLVSITPEFYRCITCGSDLKQHINGKISYIPHIGLGEKIELATRDK